MFHITRRSSVRSCSFLLSLIVALSYRKLRDISKRQTRKGIYERRLANFWENAYKKGAGRMLPTLPRQVRRTSVPLMLRGYATCFQPSPGASRTGAFVLAYSRDEARSIRQRSVSSAKSTRRLMRLTSLTRQAGVCAVPNAWEEAT